MTNDLDKIDQEELDRIEDELLEQEAEEREEKMIMEGRSVFDLERLKNLRTEERKNKGVNNEDGK